MSFEKIWKSVVAAPFAVLFFALAFAISALWSWCASRVWAWHVAPIWSALPLLSWKQLWAIGAVKGLVFNRSLDFKEEKTVGGKQMTARFLVAFAIPVLILAFAWWLR